MDAERVLVKACGKAEVESLDQEFLDDIKEAYKLEAEEDILTTAKLVEFVLNVQ